MAGVRQAVLEFDAAVQVPWRPLLASGGAEGARGTGRPVAVRAGRPAPTSAASGRPARVASVQGLPGSGPRVSGHLRPVPDRPQVRAAGSGSGAPRGRGDAVRPGGRPVRPAPAGGGVRVGCGRTPAPVRLTRRGRRLVAALALACAVGTGWWLAPVVGGGDDGLRLAGDDSVVVQPGDTVWSIAGELAGTDQDVRTVVHAIEELNDLEGSVVVPGQVLRLP
ncbi:LysM peptidoglycan-binding domain-containing protein [Geodermatophilus sp. DSM 45219]|uniref:LysM peptidoglycan-binding domain-containing protein n=1 Tax=Geodermatophilus sp. DSM 45219 TaxID=1881103 RepID=UPI00087E41D5|nr:LysM peptidoglycan-binding domain-containing protein [Geodermatophilus sp. DSM 45219]SDO43670.1 LysM domain-containing protein [Geodermatophilus sp. DSM 45219]